MLPVNTKTNTDNYIVQNMFSVVHTAMTVSCKQCAAVPIPGSIRPIIVQTVRCRSIPGSIRPIIMQPSSGAIQGSVTLTTYIADGPTYQCAEGDRGLTQQECEALDGFYSSLEDSERLPGCINGYSTINYNTWDGAVYYYGMVNNRGCTSGPISQCANCAAGQYRDQTGQSSCKSCEAAEAAADALSC